MGVQRATLVEGLGIEHHGGGGGEEGDSIQIRTSKQKVITNPLYRPKVPQAAKMKEIRKWVVIRDKQWLCLESDGDSGSI